MNGRSPHPPAYGGRVKANSMMNLFHTDEESTLFTEWSFKISPTPFWQRGRIHVLFYPLKRRIKVYTMYLRDRPDSFMA